MRIEVTPKMIREWRWRIDFIWAIAGYEPQRAER